jgi:hypothetical protein
VVFHGGGITQLQRSRGIGQWQAEFARGHLHRRGKTRVDVDEVDAVDIEVRQLQHAPATDPDRRRAV